MTSTGSVVTTVHEATGASPQQFISTQTFLAFIVMDSMLLLLVLLYGGNAHLRTKPFAPWLVGSNQCEHTIQELRAFETGNTAPSFLQLLSTIRRWQAMRNLLADRDVHLPDPKSNKGYSHTSQGQAGCHL